MSIKNMFSVFLLGLSLTVAGVCSATSLVKMDFDAMVDDASVCVLGEVVETETKRVNGVVETYTKFIVKDRAFGDTDKEITVITPGGRLPSAKIPMVEVNAGAPQFLVGSESLMLVKPAAGMDAYSVVGFNQGIFNIVEARAGNLAQLPQSQGGLMPVSEALVKIQKARTNLNK